MKAHQIFQSISETTGQKIIEFIREEDRDTYRATLATLAGQRKLRPVFVQRKSRSEQAAWILKLLPLRQCNGVCEHLLQTWLMKGFQDLLVTYLDGVGIKHDGKGEIETLPDEIEEEKLKPTVDGLLAEYDSELVAIYLHTFNLQKPGGWESITALLASEPRLQIGEAAAETPEKVPPANPLPAPVAQSEPPAAPDDAPSADLSEDADASDEEE